MKKILIVSFTFLYCFMGFSKNKEIQQVEFYGVDFSCVNVINAAESDDQFMHAFVAINNLVLAEPTKYNISKYLSLDVKTKNVNVAIERSNTLKEKNFRNNSCDIDLNEIVAPYPTIDGNVLIIIAETLDKPSHFGTYLAVVFDGKSKEMISVKKFSGNAKGFGLRNYWAGSLWNGLKMSRFSKNIVEDYK